jgi:hypothetical protein
LLDDTLAMRIANLGRRFGDHLRQHLGCPCVKLMRLIFHKSVE